ncbi:MAG: ABC transporter substrate-binding protein, partial [Lachnospiraceae bacterium]|nr:ABC transporter substrate-binding protein [Lachnospiraceae bacterium]
VTDEPTALAACVAYPDFVLLNFAGSGDDFAVDEGDINIGISIMKGNSELVSLCNEVLATMDASAYTEIMNSAIEIQPLGE